jgi:hypothetical protein
MKVEIFKNYFDLWLTSNGIIQNCEYFFLYVLVLLEVSANVIQFWSFDQIFCWWIISTCLNVSVGKCHMTSVGR